MNELIEKLKNLILSAEQTNDRLNKQLAGLNAQQAETEQRLQNAKDTELAIKKRESIVVKYENFEQQKKEVEAKLNESNKKLADANILVEKYNSLEKKLRNELDNKQSELDQLIAVYRKKDSQLDSAKSDLERRKKELRNEILEELKVNA